MVKELGLADSARVKLADGIFISIRNHCESWKSFVKSKRDMPRLEKPIPENRDLSLLSVESGEGETLEITAPAVFDSVEAPSPSSVVFMSEAEQLNNAELLRRIDELSHHTTKTADIEKKELVQLYVDLKIKQNQSERISLLEKETPAGNVSLLPQESSQASVINTPKETLDSSYPRNRHQRKGSLDLFADVDSDTMSLGESKNQAAELELIRLILEKKSPLSSQLTPDQAEELAEADRKRTYELRLHKKAYLKAKFLTNRKFNLDSMELLKKWGFDINALVQSESSSRIASSKADSNVEVGLNSGASVSENLLLTDQFPTASFASLDSQLGTAPPGSLKKTGAPKFSSRTQRALNEVDDKAKFRSHKASASNQAAVGTTTRQKARNRSDVVGGTTGIQEIDVDDIEQKLTQPFFQTRGLVASKAPTPSSNKPQNSQSQPSNSSMFSMNPQ